MPVIPENIADLQFDEKDLYLDVRLTTISNEGTVITDPDTGLISSVEDFTGFPTFKTSFFRDSIGFGITNIKVETNTSLQPIVEIEFKDLFGKTVFGDYNEDVDTEGVNYAALFQWPPPKFVFTFKGYLGAPVTWLLNMKTTSTQYNSDDGSYTIKATFVPNQWGMFADIPFLYLYAAKKLRADALDPSIGKESDTYIKATESIIDLMYIGKSIETETKSLTKEYDEVVGKLELLKRDPIQGIISGTLAFPNEDGGDENLITSKVPGRGAIVSPIKFVDIRVTKPNEKAYTETPEDILIPALKNLSVSLRNIENYKVKIASTPQSLKDKLKKGITGIFSGSQTKFPKFGGSVSPKDLDDLKEAAKRLNPTIDKNLEAIDNAIKANLFLENPTELRKLTISSVFSRIARDTAFIMGYIIDAGEQGYFNNVEARNIAEETTTIGRYYPMIFEEPKDGQKDLGNQVPAKDPALGVVNFEKKFVSDFITAISFGIAENRALQKEAEEGSDKTIKHIINNLEIGTDNPYLGQSDWSMIASIMIKRAGIVGFLTQSYNPALPGNMEPNGSTRFTWGDYKKTEDFDKIRSLANSDLANITDVVLAQLDGDNLQKLKEFCIIIRAWLVDPDGVHDNEAKILPWYKGFIPAASVMLRVFVINPGLEALAKTSKAKKIIKTIRKDWPDTKVFIPGVFGEAYDQRLNEINTTNALGLELKNAGVIAYTFEEFMGNLIGTEKAFFGITQGQKARGGRKIPATWGNGMSFETSLGAYCGMGNIVFAHVAYGQDIYGGPGEGNNIEYVVWSDSGDVSRVSGALEAPGSVPRDTGDEEEEEEEDNEEDVAEDIAEIVILDSEKVPKDAKVPDGGKIISKYIKFFNQRLAGYTGGADGYVYNDSDEQGKGVSYTMLDFNKCSGLDMLSTRPNIYFNPSVFRWTRDFGPTWTTDDDSLSTKQKAGPNYINVNTNPVVIAPYAQYPSLTESRVKFVPIAAGLSVDGGKAPYGSTMAMFDTMTESSDEGEYARMSRAFLRKLVLVLLPKIQKIQDEVDKVFGQILGKAGEHEDLIYKQFHTLFHQWQILGGKPDGTRINQPGNPAVLEPNVAEVLQGIYGETIRGSRGTPTSRERSDGKSVLGGGFRYDYPLQAVGANTIKVDESLISLSPLYSAKANTTTLNMFQQLCSKNNFMFFPICGNARYDKVTDIFAPQEMMGPQIGNFFQVMFQPTPESRTLVGNDTNVKQSAVKNLREFEVQAFPVAFGDPTNKIIKNVQVSTDENKVTAESIVNLQAIVDNDNKNKTVTTDCSLLSVFEGRSYKAGVETIGNAQISPLQFFFLENHTIFTGLYQIIKVSHKISPNDMTTDLSGIKMRYGGASYGGILPVTLQDFETAAGITKTAPLEGAAQGAASAAAQAAIDKASENVAASGGAGGSAGGSYPIDDTKGAKSVAGYLRNKDKKRRIDKIILDCVDKGITSNFAIAAVLSICSKESSFDLKSEGFFYSASRLPEVWSYFKKNDPVDNGFVNPATKKADSDKYQERIANIVYTQKPVGVRSNGYGNTKKGDGWKYRGRGYNQITFKSGYEKASKNTGVDLVKNPERLLEEDVATGALVGFFNGRRRTTKFGNKSGGYTSRKDGYGCPDNGVTFPDLLNAVFFYYHCNTGPGKTVANVKHKLSPEDPLGGMKKAQGRAPAFLDYINKNFADRGVTILVDTNPNSGGDSSGAGGSGGGSSATGGDSSAGGGSSAGGNSSNSSYAGMSTWDTKYTDKRIKTLHPKIRAKVTEFIIRADKELGIKLRVASALRTFEEQTELYNKGRTTSGKIVTYARAGSSLHNYGLAIDVVEIKNGSALWNSPNEAQISNLGKSIGFEWGGDWKSFTDKPHYEMKFGKSVQTLKSLYDAGARDGLYVRI